MFMSVLFTSFVFPRQSFRTIRLSRRSGLWSTGSGSWVMATTGAWGVVAFRRRSIEHSIIHKMPVTARHAIETGKLPSHHRDPFDQPLIAQSRVEPMYLLTRDRQLTAYGDTVLFI